MAKEVSDGGFETASGVIKMPVISKVMDMVDAETDEAWMFLDPYDSHLDARVERDALIVEALHDDGFQYLWKGIRANYGVKKGIYMYEVKILDNCQVRMPETKQENRHILRCGFSPPLSSLFLGDTADSWGWGGTGKKSNNNNFEDYGGPFGAGDVIGCIIDIDQGSISFTKNGQFMGVAFDNVPPTASETGIFPHLLLKNVKCKVNFSRKTKWFDPPGDQVLFFEEAAEDHCVVNPVDHPQNLAESEFILLCGLPACGKTYWAQKHMEANPLKNYLLLGTNSVIDQMKVMNVRRQRNYAERWQELISQATPIFNKLVEIAGKTPRNIILDQTNVYQNARRRKAASFAEFGVRKCVAIVNDEDQLAERTEKREREEGKFVPVQAVNQMRANFVAPELEDGFTCLEFPELPERDSRERVFQVRSGGQSAVQRNPGGKGQAPKSRLETRDASQIGSGGDWGRAEKEGNARPGPYSGGKGTSNGWGGGGKGGGKGGGNGWGGGKGGKCRGDSGGWVSGGGGWHGGKGSG